MIKSISGLPGHGKNQYATWLGIKAMRKGLKVYSTYPIKYRFFSLKKENFLKLVEVRTYKIDKQSFLRGEFDEGSTLIFDEAWMDFFNMDWKNVDKDEIKKYSGSRHMGLTLYYLTQNPARISPYLRDVTDGYIWVQKKLFWNKITEYFDLESVGMLVGEEFNMISPQLVIQSIYFRSKKIMKSYNDKYLQNGVVFDSSNVQSFDSFEVEYRSIFKRLKAFFGRVIEFRKSL